MKTFSLLRTLILSLALLTSVPSFAAVKKEFNVCWTIYAGWMPWARSLMKKSSISGPANMALKLISSS